ncbi:MAG: ABC transporter permease [Gemmatimonadetes bacterium]|nr:ABC transporter permease [Gemmatimonadota bacterium]MBK7833866.1 ABC transporter permease [Gemmatimonadota bacterium]
MIVLAFLVQTLRIAIPYLFAAAGGVLSERSGVIALTLEGWMLTGAFTAVIGTHFTGSPWVGLLCGVAGGVLAALLHAVACIRYRADQVVVGIAINLLAVGITRFFLRLAFDSSSNSPRVAGFDFVQTGEGGRGTGVLASLANPLVPLGVLSLVFVWWLLYRTPFGLRLRAVGEKPEAAASLGVGVNRVRWIAVLGAGALASMGGAYLALEQHQFTDSMTAGRGFIALAAVIFGKWEPKRVAVACLLFAAAETLQIQLQGLQLIPSQFVEMIPYILTIVAVAGVVGRATPPSALGKVSE